MTKVVLQVVSVPLLMGAACGFSAAQSQVPLCLPQPSTIMICTALAVLLGTLKN